MTIEGEEQVKVKENIFNKSSSKTFPNFEKEMIISEGF
jgi:hypothetical protein